MSEPTFTGEITGTASAVVTHDGPCGPGNPFCPHWAAPPDDDTGGVGNGARE